MAPEAQSKLATETDPLMNERGLGERLKTLSSARRLLYISHFFAQFSDWAWQFAIILFLAAFTDYQSLMLVSTYGLATGMSVCLFGSAAGQFIDRADRMFVMRFFVLAQNACCIMATILCYFLLVKDNSAFRNGPIVNEGPHWMNVFLSRLNGVPLNAEAIALLVGIHLLGSASMLLNQGFLVAVERDWIVVMSKLASPQYGSVSVKNICDFESNSWLSDTNVVMKQIDLTSTIAAPALAGFILSLFNAGVKNVHGQNLTPAAVLVGGLNAAALVTEYFSCLQIYSMIPDLASKDPENKRITCEKEQTEAMLKKQEEGKGPNATEEDERLQSCGFFRLPYGLRVYLRQSISLGGIGFALLYLNALTFGALMTAYLVWRGMAFATVGVWKGVASAIGLLGTVVYAYSVKMMSVEKTGMWSISFQFSCLTISYASLFVHNFVLSSAMLIGGVISSRVGLWVFDVAITQMMQQYIPEDVRGVVGGVQKALNAFFGLFAFVLGIIFPNPKEFYIYVLSGYSSVGIALVLYAFGIYFRRDKLAPQYSFD